MLLNAPDAPRSDAEWHRFVAAHTFGQLAVSDAPYPLLVPTHYVFAPERGVEFHLHRRNPVLARLRAHPEALFSVLEARAYIPAAENHDPDEDLRWAAPTSYFAAVHLLGRAEVSDDPETVAAVIRRQMERLEPGDAYHPPAPGDTPHGRMLSGVCAVRLRVDDVRVKFKFGGNRTPEVRARIRDFLLARGSDEDRAAAAFMAMRES